MHAGTMPVRCLIVDDNRDFLRAARELLSNEGISVVDGVSTGAQAGRACRELQPDVILIDFDLGEESGLDVARQLADQQAGEKPPHMILISAYPREDFEDLIADSPAVSFLSKTDLSGAAIRDVVVRAGGSVAQPPQRDSR